MTVETATRKFKLWRKKRKIKHVFNSLGKNLKTVIFIGFCSIYSSLYISTAEIDADSQKLVLDLSKKCLKKIPKTDDAQQYKVLILDDNELQKIDNIDSYLKIEKVRIFLMLIYISGFIDFYLFWVNDRFMIIRFFSLPLVIAM